MNSSSSICFRKANANSSSSSCTMHLFCRIRCLKSQMWAITGSYLNSSQMPGHWCKFLQSLFSQAHAPNLERYTDMSSKALGYRSLRPFQEQLCNKYYRLSFKTLDVFVLLHLQFHNWKFTLHSLVLYLQLGGRFETPEGELFGFLIHHGIWGQGAFPVEQRVQSKNPLNARPCLEPLRIYGHMSSITYNPEGV